MQFVPSMLNSFLKKFRCGDPWVWIEINCISVKLFLKYYLLHQGINKTFTHSEIFNFRLFFEDLIEGRKEITSLYIPRSHT